MKSILMSIQPKWCELIASGLKTIEVRKTAPKEVPFKVFMYCTKEEPNLYIPAEFNCFPLDEASQPYFAKEPFIVEVDNLANGKVIGEFVCDKVDKVINHGSGFSIFNESEAYTNCVAKQSGLYFDDLKKYLETKDGYAWHITDLKVYDKPRELGEITTYTTRRRYTTKKAKEFTGDGINIEKLMHGNRVEARIITRPPQSWQYIQELEEQNDNN